jgi:hypothetical protein
MRKRGNEICASIISGTPLGRGVERPWRKKQPLPRSVIGAWLICLALVMAFFGYPVVTTALDVWAGDLYTATAGPKPVR